jgi:hypothetical protein
MVSQAVLEPKTEIENKQFTNVSKRQDITEGRSFAGASMETIRCFLSGESGGFRRRFDPLPRLAASAINWPSSSTFGIPTR